MTNSTPTMFAEHFKDKQVLITGGLGFIGSAIANALVPLGAKVTIVDAMLPLYGGNYFNVEDIKDQIQVIEGDIRDADLMTQAVKGQDYIFNLAAQVSYIDSKDEPFLD